MPWEMLLFEVKNSVGVITLNRPDRLNALGSTLLRELDKLLDECEVDDGIRALVLTGGPKVFCVGGDIKEMRAGKSMLDIPAAKLAPAVSRRLDTYVKPVVAAIRGAALGGGMEIALCCDLRVAAETASLGLAEIKLGLIPPYGTQYASRLAGPAVAKRLIFSGNPISADEAHRCGLVDVVVPPERCLEVAMEWATEFAERPPLAVQSAKKCINTGLQMDLQSALDYAMLAFANLAGTEDVQEGLRAFAEKRKPVFQGR